MTHTDLAGLIEKLEGAEGGSRELDADVFCALGYTVKTFEVGPALKVIAYPPDGPQRCEVGKTHVTTSLDAALALVEERLGADVIYHMGRIPPSLIEQGDTGHGYYFDLPEAEHVSSPNDIHATGHTLALAAITALCRALQSDTVKGEG